MAALTDFQSVFSPPVREVEPLRRQVRRQSRPRLRESVVATSRGASVVRQEKGSTWSPVHGWVTPGAQWLSPPVQGIRLGASRKRSVCIERAKVREVMFATGKAGKGYPGPRGPKSKVVC